MKVNVNWGVRNQQRIVFPLAPSHISQVHSRGNTGFLWPWLLHPSSWLQQRVIRHVHVLLPLLCSCRHHLLHLWKSRADRQSCKLCFRSSSAKKQQLVWFYFPSLIVSYFFALFRLQPSSRNQSLPRKLRGKWPACASWWFLVFSWPGPHMPVMLPGFSSTRELPSLPYPWPFLPSSPRAQHCSIQLFMFSWTSRWVYCSSEWYHFYSTGNHTFFF